MATQENPLLSLEPEKQQQLVDLVESNDIEAIAERTGLSRRQVLGIGAMLAGGAATGGYAVSELVDPAEAQADTGDSDGNVGLPGDRVDVFADGVDGNSADLDAVHINGNQLFIQSTQPTLDSGDVWIDNDDPIVNDGSGIWTQDGNSPTTDTGVTSSTYTLSGTYDVVKIFLQIENVTTTDTNYNLRANNVSTSQYNIVTNDPNNVRVFDLSSAENIYYLAGNTSSTTALLVDGRWTEQWDGNVLKQTPRVPATEGFVYPDNDLSSPLDSLTILADNQFDISWAVYGKDVDTGGLP